MLQIEIWMLTILQIHHNWHSNGANCSATVWNSRIDILLHDHNESRYVSRLYNFKMIIVPPAKTASAIHRR